MTEGGPPLSPADGTDSGGKSPGAFRTTREVAEALDLPPHVLRFWEARFPQVKPLKRAGGRRYYRPADVELLRRIRECLYQQGYTIRGVQKLLRESALGGRREAPPWPEDRQSALFALEPPPPAETVARPRPSLRARLEEVRRDLLAIRALLDRLLAGAGPPSQP